VFIYCPLLARYPSQPVTACDRFEAADEPAGVSDRPE
jgi:hypothetical protein